MEMLRDRDIEVLCMTDPVDEFAVEAIREYDGKKFHSISRGDLDLEDEEFKEEKKKNEDLAKSNEGLLKDMKELLDGKVVDVRLSNRLKSGAVCLVADAAGPSLAMEQAFAAADNPMLKRAAFWKSTRSISSSPSFRGFTKPARIRLNSRITARCSTIRPCSSKASCPTIRQPSPIR